VVVPVAELHPRRPERDLPPAPGRSETTEWDAWSVPVAGGEPTLVLRNAAFPMYFADGKEIAFVPPGGLELRGSQHRDRERGRRGLPSDARGSGRSNLVAHDVAGGKQDRVCGVGGSVEVVDVSTGESSKVADGETAGWLDDDTLIVNPG
jgi:hypothetical protein